jgi:signal transduction histidine kinase
MRFDWSEMTRRLSCWIAGIFLLIPCFQLAAQQNLDEPASQPKRILFVYSYGQNFEPWVTWSREIRRELDKQSPWPLNIQEQYIVTALGGDDAADAKFVEYLTELYSKAQPDLIVALGAPAARFVQQYRIGLFPRTPMLLAAVNVLRVSNSLLSENDTVVGTAVDHVVLIKNILRLLPETKTLAMIIGNSPPEKFWVEEIQKEMQPLLGDKVQLLFFNERPFAETLERVSTLPPQSAIFYQQMMVDGVGAVYGDKEPLRRIAKVANAPIFTFDDTFFDGEVVGGPMSSPAAGAAPTAGAAIRMLKGEKPRDIHVPPIEFSQPKYDWRQLQRWNISEARLPPGSEVAFREPSAWERYSWQIGLITAAMLFQAGLITVLLRERHLRQIAELQSRQRMVELAHVNRISAAGELGAMVAHEINQPLGAILANAEAAQVLLSSPAPDITQLREIVGEIVQNDDRATAVIKRMRSLLRKVPFEPGRFDLNDLVRETLEFVTTLSRSGKFELRSDLSLDPLPVQGDRVQLQQVILNLAINSIDAMKNLPLENRLIDVQTARQDHFAELSVLDTGPGISDEKLENVFQPFFTTKSEGMGMGLAIARTIVEAHGGLIVATNREQGGALFRVRIPLVTV